MNTPVIPDQTPKPALAIVERYEGAVNYLYPLLLNMSHKHRVLRDSLIAALFEQYRLFYEAAKSNQASRIYIADAGLAHIKELLRFMADPACWAAGFAMRSGQIHSTCLIDYESHDDPIRFQPRYRGNHPHRNPRRLDGHHFGGPAGIRPGHCWLLLAQWHVGD